MTTTPTADVIVVGAGNAALCAALAAREQGASVLVLEKAPEHLRGGNTFFTGGGFRFPYRDLNEIRALIPDLSDEEAAGIDVGAYPQAQFYDDLLRVTEALADADLADALAHVWRVRDDRYSELRSQATLDLPKVEMSYIGG